MIKKIQSILFLFCVAQSTFAQLKVYSDGRTQVGETSASDAQFVSSATPNNGKNVGINGMSGKLTGLSVGVLGESLAGGGCFGVAGIIGASLPGAGIYGSNSNIYMPNVGNWAGYFYGNTYTSGSSYLYSLNNISDIRLKDNISLMSSQRRHGVTLQNILDMNVLEYNSIPSG